jgi:amino acid permease
MKIQATAVLTLIALVATAADALVSRPPFAAHPVATLPHSSSSRSGSVKSSSTALTTAASADATDESGFGTATIPNEVFNLVKSIVGAGVLSLPYGVAVFGNAPSALVPAISLIALMGALSAYTFGLIGRVCQRTNTNSYAEAWDASVGKKWAPLIAFSCFIDCFAGNLSYSMILADTVKNLAASAGFAVTRTNALLGVTGIVLLPLCLLKNLASLAPFSLVGIIGMLYTTAAMGLRWYSKAYSPGGAFFASQLAPPVFGSAGAASALNPATLILACMLSNAYIAHFNAPKFLKELKNNTMSRFHQVIAWSFGTSVTLYGLITAFGFLTFGTLLLMFSFDCYRTRSHMYKRFLTHTHPLSLSLSLSLAQVEPRMD